MTVLGTLALWKNAPKGWLPGVWGLSCLVPLDSLVAPNGIAKAISPPTLAFQHAYVCVRVTPNNEHNCRANVTAHPRLGTLFNVCACVVFLGFPQLWRRFHSALAWVLEEAEGGDLFDGVDSAVVAECLDEFKSFYTSRCFAVTEGL